MLCKNRFKIPQGCPDDVVTLILEANRAADKLYCLESNLSKIHWSEFEEFETEIESARENCDRLSKAVRAALHKWQNEATTRQSENV